MLRTELADARLDETSAHGRFTAVSEVREHDRDLGSVLEEREVDSRGRGDLGDDLVDLGEPKVMSWLEVGYAEAGIFV